MFTPVCEHFRFSCSLHSDNSFVPTSDIFTARLCCWLLQKRLSVHQSPETSAWGPSAAFSVLSSSKSSSCSEEAALCGGCCCWFQNPILMPSLSNEEKPFWWGKCWSTPSYTPHRTMAVFSIIFTLRSYNPSFRLAALTKFPNDEVENCNP